MQHKFCPLTKDACREDCALYVKYDIEDCNQEYYTGCAFAVNANANVATANGASGIDDSLAVITASMKEAVDELSYISANMPESPLI